MKKGIKYIFMASIAALAAASCNKNLPPVFDDANAFVAFSSSSVTVSENDGVVKIPVSLASVAGLEGSVSFTAVPDTLVKEGVKIYPQEGVNYEILTEGGTLKFDAQHRTQYIEVKGLPDGKYTGDLSVTITLSSKNMGLGYAKACKVVINDEDHPLAAILGAYTVTGEDLWDGVTQWTMTITKDSDDPAKVWFNNIANLGGNATPIGPCYGIVNEEMSEIKLPLGQATKINGLTYYGLDEELNMYDSGSMTIKITKDGDTVIGLSFEDYGIGVISDDGSSAYGAVLPGDFTAVKQ